MRVCHPTGTSTVPRNWKLLQLASRPVSRISYLRKRSSTMYNKKDILFYPPYVYACRPSYVWPIAIRGHTLHPFSSWILLTRRKIISPNREVALFRSRNSLFVDTKRTVVAADATRVALSSRRRWRCLNYVSSGRCAVRIAVKSNRALYLAWTIMSTSVRARSVAAR